MKPLTFFLMLFFTGCASDRTTMKGTVIYVEPFPYAYPLTHHIMHSSQSAWIRRADTGDSVAVLFDDSISGGGDIRKQISVGGVYLFILEPYEMPTSDSVVSTASTPDSLSSLIRSLPIISLIDSNLMVRASRYWIVRSFEKP